MNKGITLLFILSIFTACIKNIDDGTKPLPLYSPPTAVPINLIDGYDVNQYTGDSIDPLIDVDGNTIPTGVPIPFEFEIVNMDTMPAPEIIKVTPWDKLPRKKVFTNSVNISENIKGSPINWNLAEVKYIDSIHSDFVLINSEGDTIPTGVPVPAITHKEKIKFSRQIPVSYMIKNNASPYDFRSLDMPQGLPYSNIHSIVKDKDGYLWIYIVTHGLVKYDSKTLTTVYYLSDQSNDQINFYDGHNIWFTDVHYNLVCFDGNNFITYDEENWANDNMIFSIYKDSEGTIWLATRTSGLCKLKDGELTFYTTREGLCSNRVFCIDEDNEGNLLIGTLKGFSIFDGSKFKTLTEETGLSDNLVTSVISDNENKTWLGTWGEGINLIKNDSIFLFNKGFPAKDSILLNSIVKDNHNNLWVASFTNGIYKLDTNQISIYPSNKMYQYTGRINYFNESAWLSTQGAGLTRFSPHSFLNFSDLISSAQTYYYETNELDKGDLIFGNAKLELYYFDGTNSIDLNSRESLNSRIYSVKKDKTGNIWLGTSSGLYKYTGAEYIKYTKKNGLPDNDLGKILQDSNENLWLSTLYGTSVFNGKVWKNFSFQPKNNFIRTNDIFIDSRNNIWISTSGFGVIKLSDSTVTYITEKEGLNSNKILCVNETKSGNILIGSQRQGINYLKNDTVYCINKNNGLSNNAIVSMKFDNNDKLWLGTDRGLNCIQPDSISGEPDFSKIIKYDEKDGLFSLESAWNSLFIDSKNRLWWGSNKNLTMLDLNKIHVSDKPPKPLLKQIDINQQFIDYRNISDSMAQYLEFDSVKRFENYPYNLQLHHSQNHLTFHYIGIDWNAPHKIKYSYRMLGLNKQWSEPTDDLKAEYRNMPYGTYTFELCAIGESLEWSEPLNYTFTIHPPWWYTWWAKTVYALCALFLLYALIKVRTKQLEKRKEELEKEVDQATKEIRNKNEELKQQNEEINAQKEEIIVQKEEITIQRDQLSLKNQHIEESIAYAKRIQQAVLPRQAYIDEIFFENFVLFKPRDHVSGDFYWFRQLNEFKIAIAADCTGHGVPGAILSMLGISFISEIVQKREITQPSQVLNALRKQIQVSLKQTGKQDEARDGMDIAVCVLNSKTNMLQYAGANNPLYLIQNKEFKEIKADRMPIGYHPVEKSSFTNHEIQLQEGDVFYLFSDGYSDQFGGEHLKKFKASKFKELLTENHLKPMTVQKEILERTVNKWMGDHEQTDDILVVGIRV